MHSRDVLEKFPNTDPKGAQPMNKTFKMISLVGASSESFDDALKAALADASKTLRHLGWFEVVEQRGRIEEGEVVEYQVKIQVGFRIAESE